MKRRLENNLLIGIKFIKMLYIVLTICSILSYVNGYDLTVLHTNDVHARFEQTNKYSASCSDDNAAEDKCYGGVARRYTALKAIRKTMVNVILLDAGDQFQGTLWFTEYQGLATSYFMNLLGYDAMALGNHEFDIGVEGLEPFLRNASFPVLSSNIDASNDQYINGLFVPSTVIERGGERIGIVGYTTTETVFLTDIEGIKDLIFKDEITAIRREVNNLLDLGINKIIVLGHGGYLLDLEIAKQVQGVDIVVGGHSNTFLYNDDDDPDEVVIGPYPTIVEQANGSTVLVVQAYAYGKYLGFLQTIFDDDGVLTSWSGGPIILDSSVEQHSSIIPLVQAWGAPLQEIRDTVVGETYAFLDGPLACRTRECNLGNTVCDAVLEGHITGPSKPGDAWSDISLVMLNGGGFRIATVQGIMTMETVLDTIPFRNTIVMVRITGQIIHDALEHSASAYSMIDPKGSFLQFSGFHVVYDVTKVMGQRVVSVSVRCQNCTIPKYQPLDNDIEYNVLINSFMASGGDGYSMIRDNVIEKKDFGNLMSDSVADYITRHSPIYPGKEGRIYVTHGGGAPATQPPTTTSTTTTTRRNDVTHNFRTSSTTLQPMPPAVDSGDRTCIHHFPLFFTLCILHYFV